MSLLKYGLLKPSLVKTRVKCSNSFTVEFYRLFWNVIKYLVFESFVYAFDIGELSIDQNEVSLNYYLKKIKFLNF